ncbi:MAG: alpha/beta fold hydrolase [Desulfobacterota bacterium]|nr:alpha/beta fold hydrolase [Thermodesulfobacteriota bacterium]
MLNHEQSPMTLSEQSFLPEEEYIFVPELKEQVFDFVSQIWHSFVNKIVSLTFTERDYCFEYGMFEVIDGETTRIAAVSSQVQLGDIAKRRVPKEFARFKKMTRPTPVSYQTSLTSNILREAIIKRGKGEKPPVVVIDLRKDKRIHPRLKEIITDDMNHSVGFTLFFGDNPIGVLWGIRRNPLTPKQKGLLFPQLYSLSEGISTIMALEFNRGKYNYRAVRKNIEKLDTNSSILNLFYTKKAGQSTPVRTIIGRSNLFHTKFRLDASYIVPTSHGYSISLKRFLPEHENSTGKTLLMIPGFFCNRSIFDQMGREMAFRYGYKVISLDCRGRAKSTLPDAWFNKAWSIDDFIYEDFPRALTWISEQYPDERIVVFGHSMGGIIARCYTGSYQAIQETTDRDDLPDPEAHIAGIVSIASPDYVDVKLGIPGTDLMRFLAKLIPDRFHLQTISGNVFNKLLSLSISRIVPTVDLKSFFSYLFDFHESIRQLTFDLSTRILSLHDFVGFPQITPPELYLLMEDVICEESTKVMIQFLRSQVFGNSIRSFDGKINYTENLRNITLPVFHVMGSLDAIAPPETIRYGYDLISSTNKQLKEYRQGHIGLIMHPRTVREIAKTTHQWIKTL